MYVCVVVDKLNHCTAFKPRRSPRVINIHMQIYKSGNAAASWPTETRWVFLEKRSWGFRKLSGANEDAQGPRGSGAPPAGGSGHVQEKQNKTKPFKHTIQEVRTWTRSPSFFSVFSGKRTKRGFKSRIVNVWRDKLLPCLNVEVKRVDPHREKVPEILKKKKKKVPAVKQGPNVSETRGWFWWICMFVTEQQLHFHQHKPAQTETFCRHVASIPLLTRGFQAN